MDYPIKPLDKLSINEVCELAKGAALRGEPLEQANVFEGPARAAFAAAYEEHQLEFVAV